MNLDVNTKEKQKAKKQEENKTKQTNKRLEVLRQKTGTYRS